jgi:hypothetical protein
MTDQPGFSAEHIVRDTSLRRRVGYLLAGMGGLAGAGLVGVLWATEPAALPVRTQLAFAFLIVVGLAWTGFAVWVLARRPLFAVDSVVAATLALTFSTVTSAGAAATAVMWGSLAALVASGGLGLGLIIVSGILLTRARRHRMVLLTRLRELERSPTGVSEAPGVPSDESSSHEPQIRPIGPLAVALHHLHPVSAGRRHGAVLALVLGVALLVGLALLLR